MTREDVNRLHTMKSYLDGWDWNTAPWFVISEKDAKALSRVLGMYENNLEGKRLQAQRRRRKIEECLEEL